jgi:HAD superfamily hydrolase (TIGR01549 family)
MSVLLFDLDDTLVPSSRSYDHAMNVIGISPLDPVFLQARSEVKNLCPVGYPASRSRRLYFKRYLELNSSYTPAGHLELVAEYENTVVEYIGRAWQELERPRLFAKLLELVDVIGIVSNEMATLQSAKLTVMDPEWKIFDFIVTSEEIGREKPDTGIYARALEFAGAQAKDCIFVGDNYEFDVLAPLALGMQTVQSIEFLEDDRKHSECIRDLDELVGSLNNRSSR